LLIGTAFAFERDKVLAEIGGDAIGTTGFGDDVVETFCAVEVILFLQSLLFANQVAEPLRQSLESQGMQNIGNSYVVFLLS
jgi:hypothetical protein